MAKNDHPVVILGAGLAGLAAARILKSRKVPYVILEKQDQPGGYCRTIRDKGFTFDYTGHYLHLRYPETSRWVKQLMGDSLVHIPRQAAVHFRGKEVEYPFQANLSVLPEAERAEVLRDYFQAWKEEKVLPPDIDFLQWSRSTFGLSLSKIFMEPYNTKVFCRPLDQLTADWVSWAVPRPKPEEMLRGALGLPTRAFGYNPSFLYPKQGGIDHLVDAFARGLNNIQLGEKVTSIQPRSHKIKTNRGEYRYRALISSLPMNHFLDLVEPQTEKVKKWRLPMASNRVWNINLGFRGKAPSQAHWLYFPETHIPFYRVGLPANVLPAMAPRNHYSLSVEVGLDQGKGRKPAFKTILKHLHQTGLVRQGASPVVRQDLMLDHAYVLHDRHRMNAVPKILDQYQRQGIHLVGRYGQWKYSFMEAAIKEGREAALEISTR